MMPGAELSASVDANISEACSENTTDTSHISPRGRNMTTEETDDMPIKSASEEATSLKKSGAKYFGKVGSRQASRRWFQETQLHVVTTEQGFAEWFHGIITRHDSEQLLKGKSMGCFLIRVSESRFGYSLSFRAETRCRHYMITQLSDGKFVVVGERKVHRSLHTMVEYYQKNTLSNWPHVLTVPCGQLDTENTDYADLFVDNKELYFQISGESVA